MLIYYLINCALLPSWEQKYPFFARGLKLCKALKLCAGEASKARLHAEYDSARPSSPALGRIAAVLSANTGYA